MHICQRCRTPLRDPYAHCHSYGCGWRNPSYGFGGGVDTVLAVEEEVDLLTGNVGGALEIDAERALLRGDIGTYVEDEIVESFFGDDGDDGGW